MINRGKKAKQFQSLSESEMNLLALKAHLHLMREERSYIPISELAETIVEALNWEDQNLLVTY